MSRKKLFIENIFAYGFISILNKIVPFLLLPVITRMLPDASDFGVYSMYTTIVGFGTPLAILGLNDAMFREYYEKEDLEYRYNVTTTTQRLIMLSSLIILSILILFNKSFSNLFFGSIDFGKIIILAAIGVFLGGIMSPIQAPTRMQNQRKTFVVSGLISSLVTYILALVLIYHGFSYFGLIYSSIIATFVLLIFFWSRNKAFFIKGSFDWSIAKELFKIGLPLLPTFLIYWIYNSMDKIMITNMLGTFELGIYSIGSKMAQISQLIYAGFAGGYSYFKYSTMKDIDQVAMNSKLFEYLGLVSAVVFIVTYPIFPIVFELLFDGVYVDGYIVAPYLFLSPLLLMLFQVVGSQFIVIKKSYFTSLTLAIGAMVNVILNYILIRRIGIEGAAVATLVGYVISVLLVSVLAKRRDLLFIRGKIIFVYLLAISYLLLNRYYLNNTFLFSLITSILVIIFIIILYLKEIIILISNLKNKEKFKEGK
ncbi:oligosaccharide flippase family protein [Alkalibacter mobilis]|uniref:oligosaccharide flippase family protein n=1 Tax=Alkalibacter mobilis TaxID=2787712 RepID=UPI00189C9DAF|nr:oligosaccharide flippase family protein [Alkalibacter mobilis]MBF7097821.1 oligosaccharide flippase family protein [Alkalibacter mobilis]